MFLKKFRKLNKLFFFKKFIGKIKILVHIIYVFHICNICILTMNAVVFKHSSFLFIICD